MRKFVEVNARNIVNLDDIKKFIPPFISYILDLEYESSEENIMLDWIDKQLVT